LNSEGGTAKLGESDDLGAWYITLSSSARYEGAKPLRALK